MADRDQMRPKRNAGQGVDAFIADVDRCAKEVCHAGRDVNTFVEWISEDYAFVRPQDLRQPRKFYRQISSAPPVRFGIKGFRDSLVDDEQPARHYTAFVFIGFWLPTFFAMIFLYAWEVLGLIRYRDWSQKDVRLGIVGIRHGRAVRWEGPDVLAPLITRDLKAQRQC